MSHSTGPPTRAVLIGCTEHERRDHAEVAAAAPQRPEQVWVLGCAGGDEPAVGQYDVGREQVVDRSARTAASQVADAAAQRQAANAGRTK